MASSGILRCVALVKNRSSSETSALTRATRRNIPEDVISHSHRSENLKSYTYNLQCKTNDYIKLYILKDKGWNFHISRNLPGWHEESTKYAPHERRPLGWNKNTEASQRDVRINNWSVEYDNLKIYILQSKEKCLLNMTPCSLVCFSQILEKSVTSI
jgi:hypothetical protein